MAKLYSLARMTTATTGTGTITLGSAVSGYLSFTAAGVADGDIVEYAIGDGANGEGGTGTFTLSGTTLTRNVTKSTNSNAAISLSGTAQVFISPRAERLQVPRSHLAGLTLSTAGSSATFSVAAGQATDNTNLEILNLAASISKTTSAWAVGSGNGSLDTGTIANSTWYHAYLIYRPDTQVADVLTSLSATSPTLPSSYTLFRRIGSMKTDGSAHWTAFFQFGDNFTWMTPVEDVNATNPGTAAVLRTLSTPLGVKVEAIFEASMTNVAGTANGATYFSDPDTTDYAPGGGWDILGSAINAITTVNLRVSTITNTSSQIRSRANGSSTSTALTIGTRGWNDTRGKLL